MMPDSTREKRDVLKLVYPQRRVEIHTRPITAAEVMKRNPRHCVARPDVFKHPWIVVKPESVLFPGKVFYIVPKVTIYNLLKAREQNKDQTNSKQSHSPHDQKPRHRTVQKALARKLSPGNSPKFKNQNPHSRKAFQNKLWEGVSSDEEDSDPGEVKQSYAKNRRSFEISKQHYHRYSTSKVPTQNGDPNRVIKFLKQEIGLKSCLKKRNSSRKTLNLRVTFANPITIGYAESPDSSEIHQAPPIKTCECSDF